MKQFVYLFLLQKPDFDVAREAADLCRKSGARVLAQTGAEALEITASPEQADALMASGFFRHKTRRAIPVSLLQQLPEALQQVIIRWNARQHPDYKRQQREARQYAHTHRHELQHGAPYTGINLHLLEEQLRNGIANSSILPDAQQKSIMPDTGPVLHTHFQQLRQGMQKHLQDAALSRELAIAFFRSSPTVREWLLNPGVLNALKQLNLLDQQGCRKMFGTYSVGVVFVDSDRERALMFSIADRDAIINKIQEGLAFLVNQHPNGNLGWVYDFQFTGIDVPSKPNLGDADYDYDAYWRDPAMRDVKFNGKTFTQNEAGRLAYQKEMKTVHKSDAAFTIFVTKFGCSWHGYAIPTFLPFFDLISLGEHGNNWGRHGIGNLDTTVAHEMCHLFAAQDEYAGSNFSCEDCEKTSGCDRIPNGNCVSCSPSFAPCIMKTDGGVICHWTRGQIGWSDLFVELETSNDGLAETNDDVEIDIGTQSFVLDTDGFNDRERGSRNGYAIWAGGTLKRSDIKRVLIRKSSDGVLGGWKLHRVRVHHQGSVICDQTPDIWLEGGNLTFSACGTDPDIVNSLQLIVKTADEFLAGTDDDVTLTLDGRTWNLDNPFPTNDFEQNAIDTFTLDPGTGLFASRIKNITIEKSPDGALGPWKLKGLELIVNGKTVFQNNSIDKWLKDDDRVFTSPV